MLFAFVLNLMLNYLLEFVIKNHLKPCAEYRATSNYR